MAKNRVSYAIQDVFFGSPIGEIDFAITGFTGQNPDGSNDGQRYQVLQRINKIQDFNYSFELPRNQISILGKTSNVNSQQSAPSSVNINFGYICDGINNEDRMGFSLHGESLIENPVQFVSGLLNEETDRKNIYLQTRSDDNQAGVRTQSGNYPLPPTGFLYTSVDDVRDPDSPNHDYLVFQNSYINSYSINFGVGSLTEVKVGAVADNVFFQKGLDTGVGVPHINRTTAKTGFSGVNLLVPKNFNPYKGNVVSPPRPILPSKIDLSINKRHDTGIKFEIDTVQSCDISLDLTRENISYLGDKLYSNRPINFPIGINVDFDLLVSGGLTGNLIDDFFYNDQYDLNIDFKTGSNVLVMNYKISGLRLESVDYSSSIGSNKESSLSFVGDFDLDNNDKGFFVSGSVMNLGVTYITSGVSGSEHVYIITGDDGRIYSSADRVLYPKY